MVREFTALVITGARDQRSKSLRTLMCALLRVKMVKKVWCQVSPPILRHGRTSGIRTE